MPGWRRYLTAAWQVRKPRDGRDLGEWFDLFLPRGCFLSVTPVMKFVIVGGVIAADVYGKSRYQHGPFSSFVDRFDLLGPDGQVQRVDRAFPPRLFDRIKKSQSTTAAGSTWSRMPR
jgi:hypothetical protein